MNLRHLDVERSEGDDGVVSFVAMAALPPQADPAARLAAVMAEVQQVLDWAWQQFPQGHGPVEDGQDWDHDLQHRQEDGGWLTVTLTLAVSARCAEDFQALFGPADG